MVYKRRKYHYGDTHLKRRWRTKRRTKDLDQAIIRQTNSLGMSAFLRGKANARKMLRLLLCLPLLPADKFREGLQYIDSLIEMHGLQRQFRLLISYHERQWMRSEEWAQIIDADIQPDKAEKLLNQEQDLDRPGAAQFYCLHCARYFINDQALQDHFKTKVHKRRLKALELEPYTVEDSERAAGLGSFKLPQKRKIETQQPVEEEPDKKMKTE